MPTKKPRVTIFPDNLSAKIDLEEACPSVHSAERIFRDRPQVYRECVQRLSEGASLHSIQRGLRMSWNTVAAIRTRETEVIEATKKHIRGLLGVAAQLALERLIEKLEKDEVPAGVLPIATGILIDKHRQYEGEPTQTIEVKKALSQVSKRSTHSTNHNPIGAIVTIVNCHADMIFDSEVEGRGAVKEKNLSASSSILSPWLT